MGIPPISFAKKFVTSGALDFTYDEDGLVGIAEQATVKRKRRPIEFTEPKTSGSSMNQKTEMYFMQSGSNFFVRNQLDQQPQKVLPPGNFVIRQTPQGEFFLEKIADFPALGKIYGNVTGNTGRILTSFHSREKNLGVMLTGTKGSGKTLLTRSISIEGYKIGIPTILINDPYRGDRFFQFLSSIEQPTIVLIDEFEKIYDAEDQRELLTLLDGVYQSKKLFLLTCNDKWKVDSHMRNRPGRIHYLIEFDGLTPDFVEEYCKDTLKDQSQLLSVMNVCSLFNKLNFDMLQALVWEMNLYGESATQAIEMLNVKPESDDKLIFSVEVFDRDQKKIKNEFVHTDEVNGIPSNLVANILVADENRLPEFLKMEEKNYREYQEIPENVALTKHQKTVIFNDAKANCSFSILIDPSKIIKAEPKAGKFTYKTDEGFVVLTRKPRDERSFSQRYAFLDY